MKLLKLAVFAGLSLASLQSFAGQVYCDQGYSVSDAVNRLNEGLSSFQISSPSVSLFNGEYVVCISANH
jgi:hypothetical protein